MGSLRSGCWFFSGLSGCLPSWWRPRLAGRSSATDLGSSSMVTQTTVFLPLRWRLYWRRKNWSDISRSRCGAASIRFHRRTLRYLYLRSVRQQFRVQLKLSPLPQSRIIMDGQIVVFSELAVGWHAASCGSWLSMGSGSRREVSCTKSSSSLSILSGLVQTPSIVK